MGRNKKEAAEYAKKWRAKNKEKVKEARQKRQPQETIRMREWRNKNLDKNKKYQSEYKRKRRQFVYDYYGGKCACCGETQFEFLSIDHINGGGTQHRLKENIRGASMIDWLLRNELPEGFQVLCHNCNQAKGYYGKCPHQISK